MNRFTQGLIGLFLLAMASHTHADTFEYGFLPVVGLYQSSLDADTEVLPAVNLLSGLLIINSGRSSRFWIQGQYHSLEFDGSETQIGETVSGFVYTNLDEGTKAFNVDIIGEDQAIRNFTFFKIINKLNNTSQ